MPAVKQFTITPLKFDDKLAQEVGRCRARGESLSRIASDLKISVGKVSMAELVATTERVTIDDLAKLARAIVKDRRSGKSWGWLAARYGVTEGTCRAAFTAATGQPFTALDYRRRATEETATPPAGIKRASVKATRALAAREG